MIATYREPWVVDVTARATERLKRYDRHGPGKCLFSALVTVFEVNRAGGRACLQGGTFAARRVPLGFDDGGMLYFGYEWDPGHPFTASLLEQGEMPEFHAWAGVLVAPGGEDLEDGVIVDLAAEHVPDHCNEMGGCWINPWRPGPGFAVTGTATRAAPGTVCYEAVPEATILCGLMARRVAWELVREGHEDARELMHVCGGRSVPVTIGGRRYNDIAEYTVSARAALALMRAGLFKAMTGKEMG